MYRNIIGQAIYQIAVLITLLFFGKDLFGLDYDDSFKGFYHSTPRDPTCADVNSPACEFDPDFSQPNYGKLAHYTIIFQAFVSMQIFNEINARKLKVKEFYVFGGFFNNPLFLLILVSTMVVQYFLVQYGGPPVRTVPLTEDQHLICIAIGAGSLIWGVIVKLWLPATLFGMVDLEKKEVPDSMVRATKSLRSRSQKPNQSLNNNKVNINGALTNGA
jgi:hypothetical protein